ncbi:MAG: hypothetical protein JWP64_5376 [Pseudonocardia sp.]|jgi:predicted deacetylase|nr:hypothetical protein [Pseudonocardia sp.]
MSVVRNEHMTAELVVSLSGLTDAPAGAVERARVLVAELERRGVPVTHLVRPRAESGSLSGDDALVRWIGERRAAGDALALHGYDHDPDPTRQGARIGRRAEFATLPRHEAGLRLVAARRALTMAGLGTDVFVPPRWLASPGTLEAVREQGFAVCADENGVHVFGEPAGRLIRSRALGFRLTGERRPAADDRRRAETWRRRLLQAEARRTARRGGVVRIGMRAKDLRKPGRVRALLDSVDDVLAAGAVPTTYEGLAVAARRAA